MAGRRASGVMALTRATVWSFDSSRFVSHRLHAQERLWTESNCYVDLWIEVLHALDLDPLACLSFALTSDFEGDQWTFFKPPLGDLLALYGIDVQELNVWRPLPEHALTQLSLGRLLIAEADAYFLPDTAGTTYHAEHSKTSIAVQAIDVETSQLGYFHGAGYHTLGGADFVGLFRLEPEPGSALPPYVEIVKLDVVERLPPDELVPRAVDLLRAHLRRLPRSNPIVRFQERLEMDLVWLRGQELEMFHRYAFATLRQLGASCELAAAFLHWLAAHGEPDVDELAAELETISGTTKTLLLKVARQANSGKPAAIAPLLDGMAVSWAAAMRRLTAKYLPPPSVPGRAA